MKLYDRDRSDWAVVLVILLLGFLFVIVAGQWALRFTPSWTLDTDMESRLNPNSDFLTRKPGEYIEPVDPAILTQPIWANVFMTPGVSLAARTPLPDSAGNLPTEIQPTAPVTTPIVPVTNTIAVTGTIVPTNTLVWLPLPATSTPKPNKPTPKADLQITLDDSTTTYVVGGTLTYTIVVSNPGPSDVNGVTVTEVFPVQVSGAGWTCLAAGGAVCTAGGSGHINDVVNLPVGSAITYTVNVNIDPGTSGDLVNTASVNMPAGTTETDPSNNTFTDTNTPIISANLQVTITDNATVYVPGRTGRYEIVVSNFGPSNITGATVTDSFPAQILTASGSCTVSGGAVCGWSGSGNINDVVDLTFGSSITYLVDVTTDPLDFVNLVNKASVTGPGGNIESTDTDTLLVAGAPPAGMESYNLSNATINAGDPPIILNIPAAIDDDGTPDLIYYEELNGGGILMDKVIIEISDGQNWYPLLNWGDDAQNGGTNLLLPIGDCGSVELDNCIIGPGILYNNTGVLIDIPASIPNAPTSYIRLTVLSEAVPPNDGTCGINAIVPYP